jgi:quercetin dioxygenase-like cupin family protein
VSIVSHAAAEEIPWRPGYRRFTLAGKEHGVACSASLSVLEPGAGAPLHKHDALDEIIVVIEGRLELQIDGEQHLVEADHTIAIPAGVPHAFTAAGPGPTRILAFLPRQGAAAATSYLEGAPPAGADRR